MTQICCGVLKGELYAHRIQQSIYEVLLTKLFHTSISSFTRTITDLYFLWSMKRYWSVFVPMNEEVSLRNSSVNASKVTSEFCVHLALWYSKHIIQIYSGITSGRVLSGELFYTQILKVNLFAFTYRLFYEDFSPINEGLHDDQPLEYHGKRLSIMQCPVNWREIFMKQSVGKCKQINF